MTTKKDALAVIKSRYMTEKTTVLQNLHTATSNKSVAKCDQPKYVFLVDKKANKTQIAMALEEIYKDKGIKVKSVNTINVKSKARRVRGRLGRTAMKKKAIVTLSAGDSLDDQV